MPEASKTVQQLFDLRGRVAVVTGGAGLYGRQIVEALAEAGAKTFIASRSIESLENVAKSLRDRGLDVVAVAFDQGDVEAGPRLLAEVLNTASRIDVVVNNAVARPMKNWSDPVEAWSESMRVNSTGLFALTRYFGEQMAAQGGGSIVNIGSMQGMVGPDFTLYEGLSWSTPPDYFFHKGGMIQLTRFAAAKLGPSGVRCNVVCPGGFFSGQDELFVRRYATRTMLGRMANETDMKGIVIFLASDASAYITGAVIPVDGGYTAK
jgi:NAD(P)-dependent dehydrogenase (short-subunit alcohol dehydrogenase family)